MHLSPFADLNGATLRSREPRARRIGELLSVLFLVAVGTIAALTSVRADAHEQAGAPVAVSAPLSAPAR